MKIKTNNDYISILISKKIITIILSLIVIVLCSKLLLNANFFSNPFYISVFKLTKLTVITICTVIALYKLLSIIFKLKDKNIYIFSAIFVSTVFCCCQLYAEKGGVIGTNISQVVLWTLLYTGRTVIISISMFIISICLYVFLEKRIKHRGSS